MAHRRTLRGRLTLLYAALSFVGCLALAGAVGAVIRADLVEDAEQARLAGRPPPGLEPGQRALLVGLGLGTPLALLLCGVGGWYLAGRALRPLREIADVTHAIGADDLGRRLPTDGDSEVATLALSLNELFARLERSIGEVRRFTGDAAHELRTPLQALMGRLEVAIRHPHDAAELRDAISAALEESARLKTLVEQLLVLARSDAHRLPNDAESLDLVHIVAGLVERDRALAEERGMTLAADLCVQAPVYGSVQLLTRAIGNLLDNAVIHGRAGGHVTLSLICDARLARVDIVDDGPGIPEAERSRLFERFYRGDHARTRSGPEGFGLGLSIARRLVEAHGGAVSYAPHGEGSLFRIELPLA